MAGEEASAGPERSHSPTVSWFELFYDLVVVAAVSLTNDAYLGHPSAGNALLAMITMAALAWVWFLTTLYNNLFPSRDVGRRFLLVVQMAAIAIAGLAVDQVHGIDNRVGLVAYGSALLIVAVLNLVGSRVARVQTSLSVAPILAAVVICYVGAIDSNLRSFWYLIAALLVSMVPILTRQYDRWRHGSRLRLDHLRERLGLFVLIVLGEGFAQLLSALHYLGSIPRSQMFPVVFVLAFAVWWIYFDGTFSMKTDLSSVRWRLTLLGHLTLVFGIIGTLDILVLLTAGESASLGDDILVYFVGCLATVLVSFAILTFTAKGRLGPPGWSQLASAALLVLVGIVFVPRDDTSTSVIVGLSAAIVIGNAVLAVWMDSGPNRGQRRRALAAALRGGEDGTGAQAPEPPVI
jgi:low temperature requirement protein LtrA